MDGVLGLEELTQDADHAVGNLAADNHLADVHLIVVVPVQGADVAQVVTPDIGVLLVCLALHTLPHTVRYRFDCKALVYASESLHGIDTDRSSRLPLSEYHRIGGDGIVTISA